MYYNLALSETNKIIHITKMSIKAYIKLISLNDNFIKFLQTTYNVQINFKLTLRTYQI